ncbi:hypothetical protein ACWC3X_32195 [Streptomyces populi]|jgi:hypothetical protein
MFKSDPDGRCTRLLENALLEQAPDHLDVMRETTVRLDSKNRPEPDVMVFPADANTGPGQTWYEPQDLLPAVDRRRGGPEPVTGTGRDL